MIGTKDRAVVGNEPRSRRDDEIQWLEELWASPARTLEEPRPDSVLRRWRSWIFPAAVGVGWLAFLSVLFATAPPPDPAGTPYWAQQVAGFMFLALLATPLGFLYKFAGWGASAIAGLSGAALGVSCFAAGHTGAWPSYQVAGFVALAAISTVAFGRSLKQR